MQDPAKGRFPKQQFYGLLALVSGGLWVYVVPVADALGQPNSRHGVPFMLICLTCTQLWWRVRQAAQGQDAKLGEGKA